MIVNNLLYNDEVQIDFNTFNHVYSLAGKNIPSVTGITGTISKPQLIGWAVGEAVGFMQDKIKAGVQYDEVELVGLFNEAKKAHTRSRDKSADIGTLVHEWVRQYIKGENPDPPINTQLQTSINLFLNWEKEHKVKFLCSEQVVYSRQHHFCGTFDFNALVNGQLTLMDMKTSSGVYDEMFAQLAGYELARSEEFPTEKYQKRAILWISRNGDFDVVESKRPDVALEMFLGAKKIFDAQKTYKADYFEAKKKAQEGIDK
jgi:hypothetical protein